MGQKVEEAVASQFSKPMRKETIVRCTSAWDYELGVPVQSLAALGVASQEATLILLTKIPFLNFFTFWQHLLFHFTSSGSHLFLVHSVDGLLG